MNEEYSYSNGVIGAGTTTTTTSISTDNIEELMMNYRTTLADNDRIPFPKRLYDLLDDVENTGETHIVSWRPNGRCFKIINRSLFMERIVPRYFKKQSHYKSFVRQLNLYDFKCISSKGSIDKGSCKFFVVYMLFSFCIPPRTHFSFFCVCFLLTSCFFFFYIYIKITILSLYEV